MINKRFTRLLVIKKVDNDKYGFIQYQCLCDCGNIKITKKQRLLNMEIKSCGCLLAERRHNKSNHKLYGVWINMIRRCNKKNYYNYEIYGGRGISVCKSWEKDFMNFYNWSINNGYKNGLSIDRINNNRGYRPDNCRYVDTKTNSQNQRRSFYWVIDEVHYPSAKSAAESLKISKTSIQRMCKGYFSKLRNKHYKRKEKCYVERKYHTNN